MQLTQTIIKFPEIKLQTRDAHKLRGYFGNLFKEHSELLHNHFANGSYTYRYPLVQYKVIDKIPFLVGINEGGELLINLFLKIKELVIEEQAFPVYHKNIENIIFKIDVGEKLFIYHFKTLWMALNQKNYKEYLALDKTAQQEKLDSILISNILSFFKGVNYYTDKKILLKANLVEKQTMFKGKKMKAFSGNFTTNALLPDYIGLGKSVSRGFGAILQFNNS
ncbi:MAG: hypothetical protein K8S16_06045 [Bacteroidales bacterium]|nr:hypothetical protein [Bacteroidales bacterium]